MQYGPDPDDRDALRKAFHELGVAAGVTPQHGRGRYGLRRIATDAAPAYSGDRRVLDKLSGWTAGSTTREDTYQNREDELLLAETAAARQAWRIGQQLAAEGIPADGAYFRVHHFARQLASPFPLLAAVGARTSRIEIGTAVMDMRYENPFYMIEDASAADLISNGRLQLGISRGSPEQVIEGWRHFGYTAPEGGTDADLGRRHGEVFLELLKGEGFARPNPRPMFPNPPGLLRLEPHSEGLRDRIWWGSASNATAEWAAKQGMNLQSSTLKADESGEPFHVQQSRRIRLFRKAWTDAGHTREPRVSVSRSYAAEPDALVEELRGDEAIAEADTLLLTVPNTLGVEYNAHVIESILTHVAPALGWR